MKRGTVATLAVIAIAVAGIAWFSRSNDPNDNQRGTQIAGIKVPALSKAAAAGEAVFEAKCAACHGRHAAGSESGPPLVHKIYEPSHHADFSFHRAIKVGVRAHHWSFGDMPRIPGVNEADVQRIIAYVRELQRANGIH